MILNIKYILVHIKKKFYNDLSTNNQILQKHLGELTKFKHKCYPKSLRLLSNQDSGDQDLFGSASVWVSVCLDQCLLGSVLAWVSVYVGQRLSVSVFSGSVLV